MPLLPAPGAATNHAKLVATLILYSPCGAGLRPPKARAHSARGRQPVKRFVSGNVSGPCSGPAQKLEGGRVCDCGACHVLRHPCANPEPTTVFFLFDTDFPRMCRAACDASATKGPAESQRSPSKIRNARPQMCQGEHAHPTVRIRGPKLSEFQTTKFFQTLYKVVAPPLRPRLFDEE